jgi:hypothetical protein
MGNCHRDRELLPCREPGKCLKGDIVAQALQQGAVVLYYRESSYIQPHAASEDERHENFSLMGGKAR